MTYRGSSRSRRTRRSGAWRFALLALLVVAAGVIVHVAGWDDVHVLRGAATHAGLTGAVLFALGYAAVTLTPLPKNALSTTAGLVFGFGTGLLVVWTGAVLGAMTAFALARWLGRGRDRLTGKAMARLNTLLATRGLLGAVLVRLIPVLPFTVINYGSGLTSLRVRHYVLGTAVGIVPGSAVFVGLGAGALLVPGWATAGLSAVIVLVLLGLCYRSVSTCSARADRSLAAQVGDVKTSG